MSLEAVEDYTENVCNAHAANLPARSGGQKIKQALKDIPREFDCSSAFLRFDYYINYRVWTEGDILTNTKALKEKATNRLTRGSHYTFPEFLKEMGIFCKRDK